MRAYVRLALSTLTSALLLSGCNTLGPHFQGLKNPPIPKAWKAHNADNSDVVTWWRGFHDPTLNTLVEKAYRQNLDIQSAGLRILQARAALGIADTMQFPQLQQLNADASTTYTNASDIHTANIRFDMGWELDIWGKYARTTEASQAALYASVAGYDAVIVSVIAEVARNYINYRTAQERLGYAKRNVIIQERVTEMTRIQFNSGNVSELDMQQARTQLYNTKSAIPALQLDLVRSRNALALLLGEDASTIDRLLYTPKASAYQKHDRFIAKHRGVIQLQEDKSVDQMHLIPQISIDPHYRIDANLITQRPDIKAAEHLVHVEAARVGALEAELYPSFSLFGSIGYHPSDQFGKWINGSDALAATIGPSFRWNIFQYDRIKNQIRLQDATFEERLLTYNKSILSAVSEVSTALSSYQLTRLQQKENRKALDATVRAFNLSVIQYNDGLVSYQRLLTTVEKLTTVQDRFAVIKGSVALSAVALYKALGGGWQMSRGKRYLSKESIARMRARTDWGEYLDENMTRLPKEFTAHAK